MGIILEGFITGLLLSIFVGATFFMLIETSMTRGFRAALWFDLGVLVMRFPHYYNGIFFYCCHKPGPGQ